ncbi:hypothetical protein ACFY5K_25655 [Streptomyces griseofuscus]|uniref:hypothetical protein n=1 Tax=Streptomyces griseofuscus TaxID=146922 RepID=UPI0036C7105C
MNLSDIFSYSGLIVGGAVIAIAAFRTNTAKVWKEEAEAQKARAERLQSDLQEIKQRLTHIERDNARLISLLTALDPTRLADIRLMTNPTEDN